MNSPPLFCMHAQQILCFQILILREKYIFQATVGEVNHNLYPWTHIAEHECECQPNLASKIVWKYTEKKIISIKGVSKIHLFLIRNICVREKNTLNVFNWAVVFKRV